MNLRSNILRSALVSNQKQHGKVTECILRGTCDYIPEEYLDSVTVSGICSQESTPTPSSPVAITCNNGEIKASPNLINYTNFGSVEYLGITLSVDSEGVFTINGTTTNAYYSSFNIPCILPVGTYTLKVYNDEVASTGTYEQVGLLVDNSLSGGRSVSLRDSNPTATFTTTASSTSIQLRLVGPYDNYKFKIQLEKGFDATPYRPYGSWYVDGTTEQVQDVLSNTALAEPLLACGDYKDTQEILSGIVTRSVGVKVLDGSENWRPATNNRMYIQQVYTGCINPVVGSGYSTKIWSNRYYHTGYTPENTNNSIGIEQVKGAIYIRDNVNAVNATTWTQYLSDQFIAGTPVIIVYPLETETTESVSPQILKKANVTRVEDAAITWTTSNHTIPTMDMPLRLQCNNGPIVFSNNVWSVDSEHGVICKFTDKYNNVVESPWLLGCGVACDTYNPLTDTISRCMNVVQFDGSENWTKPSNSTYTFAITKSALSSDATYWSSNTSGQTLCSHTAVVVDSGNSITLTNTNISADSVEAWTTFLAAQKTAGTPVTLIYPKEPVVTNNALNGTQLVYKGPLRQTQGSLSMFNHIETNVRNMPVLKWKMSDLGINLEAGESQALPANSYLYNGHYYAKEVIMGYLDNDTWLEEEGGSALTLPNYECYLYDGSTWYEYDTTTWEELSDDPHNDNFLGNALGVNGYIVGDNVTLHQIDHYEYKEGMLINQYITLTANDNITIGKVSGHGTLKVVIASENDGNALLKWDNFNSATTTQEQTVPMSFNSASGNIQTITFDLTSAGLVYTDLRVSFNTTVKVYAITWEPDSYFWDFAQYYILPNNTPLKNQNIHSFGKNLSSQWGQIRSLQISTSIFSFPCLYLSNLGQNYYDIQIGPFFASKGTLNIFAMYDQKENVITVTNMTTGNKHISETFSNGVRKISIPIDEILNYDILKITMTNTKETGHAYFLAFEFIPEN